MSDRARLYRSLSAATSSAREVRQLPQECDPVLVQGELRTGEYTDEKKVTRRTVELVAQTIRCIDYTKLG